MLYIPLILFNIVLPFTYEYAPFSTRYGVVSHVSVVPVLPEDSPPLVSVPNFTACSMLANLNLLFIAPVDCSFISFFIGLCEINISFSPVLSSPSTCQYVFLVAVYFWSPHPFSFVNVVHVLVSST